MGLFINCGQICEDTGRAAAEVQKQVKPITSGLIIIWLTKPKTHMLESDYTTLLLYYKKINKRMEIYMNKQQLVKEMSQKAGLTKTDTEKVLTAFIDTVQEELIKGEKVQLVGFGTFEVVKRAAREGRNPQTGGTILIKESKAPKFKAGKSLKDLIKGI